jgi:hypothetical protein
MVDVICVAGILEWQFTRKNGDFGLKIVLPEIVTCDLDHDQASTEGLEVSVGSEEFALSVDTCNALLTNSEKSEKSIPVISTAQVLDQNVPLTAILDGCLLGGR